MLYFRTFAIVAEVHREHQHKREAAMVTRYVAVLRKPPASSTVQPITEGEEFIVDDIGTVSIERDELGFYILRFPSSLMPTVRLSADPGKLRWTSAINKYPFIGVFDTEDDAHRAMLHEVHGELARMLGVENTWEAVAAEFRRLQEEAAEEDGWFMDCYSDEGAYSDLLDHEE